jgi:hypothetical protein
MKNSERTTGYGTILTKPAVDLASVRLTRSPPPEPMIGAVEVGIPVPKKPGREASEVAAAVYALQAGQSRLFRNVDAKRLYGYAKMAKQKGLGTEYAIRTVEDGIRVWRLA